MNHAYVYIVCDAQAGDRTVTVGVYDASGSSVQKFFSETLAAEAAGEYQVGSQIADTNPPATDSAMSNPLILIGGLVRFRVIVSGVKSGDSVRARVVGVERINYKP